MNKVSFHTENALDPSSQSRAKIILRSMPFSTMQPETWNSALMHLPEPHILQTWQWGAIKSAFGWQVFPTLWENGEGKIMAAALVLVRRISVAGLFSPLGVMYIPKGPLLRDWRDETLRSRILEDLVRLGQQHGCIFVKIDPDVRLGIGIPNRVDAVEDPVGTMIVHDLRTRGWCFSKEQIQFRNTVMVNLDCSDEELLARFKQKTRYNLRLAIRHGVAVRRGTHSDLAALYHMYVETSLRDGFVIRDESYYRKVWETFMNAGMAEPLIAEVQGEPVAAVILCHFARKAWFLYGMSRNVHREKMVNYLLQWESMLRLKTIGCTTYDLWGAPDEFHENDPLWGVYRFKEGWGGQVVRHIGAWDFPIQRVTYWLYMKVMPRVLDVMRVRGIRQTRRKVQVL